MVPSEDACTPRSRWNGSAPAPSGVDGGSGELQVPRLCCAASRHHSTDPQKDTTVVIFSCLTQELCSPGALPSYYKSPSLGMFPLVQSYDESIFDQSTRGIPGKATLAVAERVQETLEEWRLMRGREQS